MADNELELTAAADPRVTSVLREHYAAPRDEAYWTALHAAVMGRIAADQRASWLQIAAGWARPGLAAAAAVLIVAAALFRANAGEPEQVTFVAAMAQAEPSQPEFVYTEYDAASQRDETLRFVVAH